MIFLVGYIKKFKIRSILDVHLVIQNFISFNIISHLPATHRQPRETQFHCRTPIHPINDGEPVRALVSQGRRKFQKPII